MEAKKKSRRSWKWTEGLVDSEGEHIKITYGDDSIPVALVAPRGKQAFVVQFVLTAIPSTTDSCQKILQATRKELDIYLVEKKEEDPWAYAIYHCSTAANLHSPVHWGYYPKGYKDWLSERFEPHCKNTQHKKEVMKICPKCNKRMEEALQVVETEASWWEEEGFYVAKPTGRHRIYEKCLICGTELQEMDPAKGNVGVQLVETPEFQLPEDGQILRQTRESFENLVIHWIEVTKMSEARLGHGVQFRYPGIEGVLMAFIDGFEWGEGTESQTNVFIRSAESEFWSSCTEDPQKILRTLKECVRLVLREEGARYGIIKDNIFCIFNA